MKSSWVLVQTNIEPTPMGQTIEGSARLLLFAVVLSLDWNYEKQAARRGIDRHTLSDFKRATMI